MTTETTDSQRARIWNLEHPENCKRNQRNYRIAKRAQLQQIVDTAKCRPCVDCHRVFAPVCMDFDHVRGIKRAAVANLVNKAFSEAIVRAEIAKCDIVCACCHRLRTQHRKQLTPVIA